MRRGGASQAGLEMWAASSPALVKRGPQAVASTLDVIWFVIVVRMALRKHYGEFRIALVPRGRAGAA